MTDTHELLQRIAEKDQRIRELEKLLRWDLVAAAVVGICLIVAIGLVVFALTSDVTLARVVTWLGETKR